MWNLEDPCKKVIFGTKYAMAPRHKRGWMGWVKRVVIESRDLPKIFDLCDKDHHGEIDDRAIFGCRTSDRWLRVGMIR